MLKKEFLCNQCKCNSLIKQSIEVNNRLITENLKSENSNPVKLSRSIPSSLSNNTNLNDEKSKKIIERLRTSSISSTCSSSSRLNNSNKQVNDKLAYKDNQTQSNYKSQFATNSINNNNNNNNGNSSSNLLQQSQKKQQLINFEMIDNEHALKTLIRLAKVTNPRQMKLPKNVQTTFEIPGFIHIYIYTNRPIYKWLNFK